MMTRPASLGLLFDKLHGRCPASLDLVALVLQQGAQEADGGLQVILLHVKGSR